MDLYTEYIIKAQNKYSYSSRYFTFSEKDLKDIRDREDIDFAIPHIIGLIVTNKLDGYSIKKISWGKDGDMVQVNFDDFTNLQECDAGFGKNHNEAMNNFIEILNKDYFLSR